MEPAQCNSPFLSSVSSATCLPGDRQTSQELQRPVTAEQVKAARQRVLDGLFWELTYWKMPNLYGN